MGVEKDELTIHEAVAREAKILRDSTGSSYSYSRSYSSSYSGSYSRTSSTSPRSGRRRRRNSVRISVSGWVEDHRHSRRRRTRDWSGS